MTEGATIAETGTDRSPDAHLDLTNTGKVLLGMIAEGHQTGYSIKAEVERSTRFYWSASIGGIYPELRRLRADGLVDRADDPRGGSRRHAYRLTAAGRKVLRDWLVHPREDQVEIRNEGLLKLRFAEVLEPGERFEVLKRMRARHSGRTEKLKQRLEGGGFDDLYDQLTVEYALGWNEWARDWCDSALARIAN